MYSTKDVTSVFLSQDYYSKYYCSQHLIIPKIFFVKDFEQLLLSTLIGLYINPGVYLAGIFCLEDIKKSTSCWENS